jgi:hypothetical protein
MSDKSRWLLIFAIVELLYSPSTCTERPVVDGPLVCWNHSALLASKKWYNSRVLTGGVRACMAGMSWAAHVARPAVGSTMQPCTAVRPTRHARATINVRPAVDRHSPQAWYYASTIARKAVTNTRMRDALHRPRQRPRRIVRARACRERERGREERHACRAARAERHGEQAGGATTTENVRACLLAWPPARAYRRRPWPMAAGTQQGAVQAAPPGARVHQQQLLQATAAITRGALHSTQGVLMSGSSIQTRIVFRYVRALNSPEE